MDGFLRALRLLTIVIWVGGLVFFAFVEAPTAFHVMGTTRQFAQLIGSSVHQLNRLGLIAGIIFLLATALLWLRARRRSGNLLVVQMLFVLLMIAATLFVQARILPAMERDRASAGGDIAAAPTTNPARHDFDRLHARSEQVEGTALLLGIGVVLLMAAEGRNTGAPRWD